MKEIVRSWLNCNQNKTFKKNKDNEIKMECYKENAFIFIIAIKIRIRTKDMYQMIS